MAKVKGNVIGAWAFLIGVVLAVIFGVLKLDLTTGIAPMALVVLGLIIGLLNVIGKEKKDFLLAGLALVIVSVFGAAYVGTVPYVKEILVALVVLFVPATIITALKVVFDLAKR